MEHVITYDFLLNNIYNFEKYKKQKFENPICNVL